MYQRDKDLGLPTLVLVEDLAYGRDSDLESLSDQLCMKPITGDALLISSVVLPLLDERRDTAFRLIADGGRVLLGSPVRRLSLGNVLLDRVTTCAFRQIP